MQIIATIKNQLIEGRINEETGAMNAKQILKNSKQILKKADFNNISRMRAEITVVKKF